MQPGVGDIFIAKLIPDGSVCAWPEKAYRQDLHRDLRNVKGATAVNVYAACAREDLPVSVSLCRHEIIEPNPAARWNITNPQERLDELAVMIHRLAWRALGS